MRQVILSNTPPDETSGSFVCPSDGPIVFTFYGSCYSSVNNVMTGVQLLIDGKMACEGQLFSNDALQHRTFTPVCSVMTLDPSVGEKHTVSIKAMANTVIDYNDRFTVVIDY